MKLLTGIANGLFFAAAALVVGCSDNSASKAELASLQASYYSAVATNSSLSSSIATYESKLANGASYKSCMTSATTDAARSACNSIAF